MMRWMILGLTAAVLVVVAAVVVRCRPEMASCPTYVAQLSDPARTA